MSVSLSTGLTNPSVAPYYLRDERAPRSNNLWSLRIKYNHSKDLPFATFAPWREPLTE